MLPGRRFAAGKFQRHFEHSDKVRQLVARRESFMAEHIYPIEQDDTAALAAAANPWRTPARMDDLKARARAAGL
jgi:acyl-CoA dehydrogenase